MDSHLRASEGEENDTRAIANIPLTDNSSQSVAAVDGHFAARDTTPDSVIARRYWNNRSERYGWTGHVDRLREAVNAFAPEYVKALDAPEPLRGVRDAVIEPQRYRQYARYEAAERRKTQSALENLKSMNLEDGRWGKLPYEMRENILIKLAELIAAEYPSKTITILDGKDLNAVIYRSKSREWCNLLSALGLKDKLLAYLVRFERFGLTYNIQHLPNLGNMHFPPPPSTYTSALSNSTLNIGANIQRLHIRINVTTPDQYHGSTSAWLFEVYMWTDTLVTIIKTRFPKLDYLRVSVDGTSLQYLDLYHTSSSIRIPAEAYIGYIYDLTVEIINLDTTLGKKIDKRIRFFGGPREEAPTIWDTLMLPMSASFPSYRALRRRLISRQYEERQWIVVDDGFWPQKDRDDVFAVVGLQPQEDGRLMSFR